MDALQFLQSDPDPFKRADYAQEDDEAVEGYNFCGDAEACAAVDNAPVTPPTAEASDYGKAARLSRSRSPNNSLDASGAAPSIAPSTARAASFIARLRRTRSSTTDSATVERDPIPPVPSLGERTRTQLASFTLPALAFSRAKKQDDSHSVLAPSRSSSEDDSSRRHSQDSSHSTAASDSTAVTSPAMSRENSDSDLNAKAPSSNFWRRGAANLTTRSTPLPQGAFPATVAAPSLYSVRSSRSKHLRRPSKQLGEALKAFLTLSGRSAPASTVPSDSELDAWRGAMDGEMEVLGEDSATPMVVRTVPRSCSLQDLTFPSVPKANRRRSIISVDSVVESDASAAELYLASSFPSSSTIKASLAESTSSQRSRAGPPPPRPRKNSRRPLQSRPAGPAVVAARTRILSEEAWRAIALSTVEHAHHPTRIALRTRSSRENYHVHLVPPKRPGYSRTSSGASRTSSMLSTPITEERATDGYIGA